MNSPPQALAILRFSGRFTPGVEPTGPRFRAEFDLGTPGMLHMAYVELDLPPVRAAEANARVWLLSPELVAGGLREGMPFKAFGGRELVAEGTIVSVVDAPRAAGPVER
jgi:hypothetical protein